VNLTTAIGWKSGGRGGLGNVHVLLGLRQCLGHASGILSALPSVWQAHMCAPATFRSIIPVCTNVAWRRAVCADCTSFLVPVAHELAGVRQCNVQTLNKVEQIGGVVQLCIRPGLLELQAIV